MDKKTYADLVNKICPKEKICINALVSFLFGGLMGLLGEFIIELYQMLFDIPFKEASTYMIITLIFFGCLFTCFGWFDKVIEFENEDNMPLKKIIIIVFIKAGIYYFHLT